MGASRLRVNEESVNNARRKTALVYKQLSHKVNFIVGLYLGQRQDDRLQEPQYQRTEIILKLRELTRLVPGSYFVGWKKTEPAGSR